MNIVALNDVTYQYPSGHQALKSINLSLRKGENLAIIGQNGAGKTTCVKLLTGLLRPNKGSIQIKGNEIAGLTVAQLSRHIGYVFQNPDDQIFNSTIKKEIAFGLKMLKLDEATIDARVNKYAKLVKLDHLLDENPYNISYSIRKFITIASVLAIEPEIVILDEPTAGQDEIGLAILADVLDYLKQQGQTIIVITHDMEFVANHFDRVVVMTNAEIAFDGPIKDAFLDEEMIKRSDIKKPIVLSIAQAAGIKETLLTIEAFKSYLKRIR